MSTNGPGVPRTRVTARIRELRFDAGSLSLNLVATVGRRPITQIERLDGIDRLRKWCAGVGLTLHEAEYTLELLESLRDLRAASFDVATAVLHDRRPEPASVELLNRRAGVPAPAPRLRLGDSGVHADESSLRLSGAALQSLVARDLITLVGDPARRSRLRECDSEICRMIYLDVARGRARRWCSMQRCGNSAKAAQHRRRTSQTPE